jgi:hypothetical protein
LFHDKNLSNFFSIWFIGCVWSRKPRLTVVMICYSDHVTSFYPKQLALISLTRRPDSRYSWLADWKPRLELYTNNFGGHWGEEKLHLGVREQKGFNMGALEYTYIQVFTCQFLACCVSVSLAVAWLRNIDEVKCMWSCGPWSALVRVFLSSYVQLICIITMKKEAWLRIMNHYEERLLLPLLPLFILFNFLGLWYDTLHDFKVWNILACSRHDRLWKLSPELMIIYLIDI